MKRSLTWVMWMGLLYAPVACGGGDGGGGQPQVQSFPLKTCDQDQDCDGGFFCSPVYCTDRCIPDGSGKCLPCNEGKVGECLPKPATACEDITCPPGDQCVIMCNGACDPAAGQCKDVSCVTACIPAPDDCATDADCGPGKHCETMCLKGCVEPVFEQAGAPRADKCPGMACKGTCVDDPPPPAKCNRDEDCPDGQVCEGVLCPMMCAPDGKGGCLPCNDGFLGQCVPKPQWGCMSDADCQEGEFCQVVCTGVCGAFAQGDSGTCYDPTCFGQCLSKQGCAGVDCGPGYECLEVCAGCAEPMAPGGFRNGAGEMPPCGECLPQCVPVGPKPGPCDTDADCPKGFVCELVYCVQTDSCLPDGSGGCVPLPCNEGHLGVCVRAPDRGCTKDSDCAEGERCEVYCMGACDPATGCGEMCSGVCIPTGCGGGCPEGFECVTVCPDCGPGVDCTAKCIEECVPSEPPADRCNADEDCPPGHHCEPVVCTMVCMEDGQGGCLPCNDGFLGRCEPDAQQGCQSDADCAQDERCETVCMGVCPPDSYCIQPCYGVCVKKEASCGSDADCPEGFYCELLCPAPCGPFPAGAEETPACIGAECVGQCVPRPAQCASDQDCPAGYACVEQGYCPPCVYSDPACLMPCTTQKVCLPQPAEGCRADTDCEPNQKCEYLCPMACSPEDCDLSCWGVCVDMAD